MPSYFVWTIGCQMNKAESQQIAGYLSAAGYKAASSLGAADLVVLNTCVVRQSAENKALGTLSLLKGLKNERSNLRILVTGCLVDSNARELEKQFPHIDLLFKPGDYSALIAWGHEHGISIAEHVSPGYAANDTQKTLSPCAFVPIIQGCDNFCSYCIVPYRRGREVSSPPEEIVCEVKELVNGGIKEVTLVGQNVDSYGHDLAGRPDLADLLGELNSIDELSRIRFLTNHPKDVTAKLIEAMSSLDKVCGHLELPVQSADNDILKAMRRGYTVERYRELVGFIRHKIPEISLSTDVIVGFPGETEEQFERSLSLVEEARFDVVHVAAYSPRPGTMASREYQDDVPAEVKKERLNKIEEFQTSIAGEINSQLRGNEVEVLVEGRKGGRYFGRTRSNKLVFFEDTRDRLGQLVTVRIENTTPWSLRGQARNDLLKEGTCQTF
jgi:tRNA-2-methylthio-N6-dimethylallyladenosine synthase